MFPVCVCLLLQDLLQSCSRDAGGREIVGKKEGEQKGSARGSVHWGCYYATALDIEVDPQRCCLGSCQSDFACSSGRCRMQRA